MDGNTVVTAVTLAIGGNSRTPAVSHGSGTRPVTHSHTDEDGGGGGMGGRREAQAARHAHQQHH